MLPARGAEAAARAVLVSIDKSAEKQRALSTYGPGLRGIIALSRATHGILRGYRDALRYVNGIGVRPALFYRPLPCVPMLISAFQQTSETLGGAAGCHVAHSSRAR